MKRPEIKLGKVQLHIMQFLWDKGEATAREITQHLEPVHNLSHSTVQTLLRKLEVKGAVDHIEQDRVFFFRAVAKKDAITTNTTKDFLDRVFHGSVSGLVAHLLENENVSREELDHLRQLIDERKERSDEL